MVPRRVCGVQSGPSRKLSTGVDGHSPDLRVKSTILSIEVLWVLERGRPGWEGLGRRENLALQVGVGRHRQLVDGSDRLAGHPVEDVHEALLVDLRYRLDLLPVDGGAAVGRCCIRGASEGQCTGCVRVAPLALLKPSPGAADGRGAEAPASVGCARLYGTGPGAGTGPGTGPTLVLDLAFPQGKIRGERRRNRGRSPSGTSVSVCVPERA